VTSQAPQSPSQPPQSPSQPPQSPSQPLPQAKPKLVLQVGRAYESRAGDTWICFRVYDNPAYKANQARCIRLGDERIGYFTLDGKCEVNGSLIQTLVKMVLAPGQEWLETIKT
jgi:hypothetical protein